MEAFTIEVAPAKRSDEQFLEPDKFSEWQWRVTPRKHGVYHLLLYVTPILYIDGIGESRKYFPQPPRVITVTPDYWYEFLQFLKEHWKVEAAFLGPTPFLLWFRRKILERFKKYFGKRKRYGFD